MSWNNVDDKHKRRFDKNFVSCTEVYERKYLVDVILDEFPGLSRTDVERAVDSCCQTVPGNKPRDKFIECLRGKLGGN